MVGFSGVLWLGLVSVVIYKKLKHMSFLLFENTIYPFTFYGGIQ